MSKKNLLQNITYASLGLALFFLPLKTSWSNIGLILLMLTTLVSFIFKGIDTSPLKKKSFYFLTPLVLFIPVLIGILYSPLKMEALGETEKMIFFLLLPLLALRKDLDVKNLKKWGAYGLIAGCFVSAVILLGIDFFRLSKENLTWHVIFSHRFTNMEFVAPFKNMHPIYMGSYYVMALIFMLNSTVHLKKWIQFFVYIFIFTGVLFLNSRIIYLSTFLILLLFLIERLPWQKFALLVTVFIIALAISLPYLKKTFVYNKVVNGTIWDLTENIGTHNTDTKATSDSRMSRWIAAWELFENKPLTGYGTGTENEMLAKKYKQYQMKVSLERMYNSHNQFLGYLVRFGIFGGLLILIFLVGSLYTALKHKDLGYLGFLLMMTSIFLVENYLDRNMGINFMAVFGILFYLNYRKPLPSAQKPA